MRSLAPAHPFWLNQPPKTESSKVTWLGPYCPWCLPTAGAVANSRSDSSGSGRGFIPQNPFSWVWPHRAGPGVWTCPWLGSSRVEPDARSGLGGLSPCPQPYPLCPLPCSLRDKHVAFLCLCPRDIWEVLAKGGATFGVPGPRGEVWDDCPVCVHPRKGQLEDFIYSSERV